MTHNKDNKECEWNNIKRVSHISSKIPCTCSDDRIDLNDGLETKALTENSEAENIINQMKRNYTKSNFPQTITDDKKMCMRYNAHDDGEGLENCSCCEYCGYEEQNGHAPTCSKYVKVDWSKGPDDRTTIEQAVEKFEKWKPTVSYSNKHDKPAADALADTLELVYPFIKEQFRDFLTRIAEEAYQKGRSEDASTAYLIGLKNGRMEERERIAGEVEKERTRLFRVVDIPSSSSEEADIAQCQVNILSDVLSIITPRAN